MLTLAEAAQKFGLHRSNLPRAIKAGRISGVRVYGDLRSAPLQPAHPDAVLELKLEHAEERIRDLTRRAERVEREADEWREQAKRLALPSPSAPHQPTQPDAQPITPMAGLWRRAWRWMRARG